MDRDGKFEQQSDLREDDVALITLPEALVYAAQVSANPTAWSTLWSTNSPPP